MKWDALQRFSLATPGVNWAGWYRPGAEDRRLAGKAPPGENRAAGDGPSLGALDLLLLHGTAGSSHCWIPVCTHLAPTVSVLIPDLPGHGQTRCTRHGRHGIEEMAEDLQALIQALSCGSLHLIAGHSAGAAIAIEFALAGERGSDLALTPDAILGIAPSLVPPPSLYTLMLGPILAPLVGSRASIAVATHLARSTGLVDRLLDSTGSTIALEQRTAYRLLLSSEEHLRGAIDFMTATDLPGLLDRLHGLRTQTAWIVASDDPWIPAARLHAILHQYLPGAPVEHCLGGHLLPESDPARIAQRIMALLGRPANPDRPADASTTARLSR
jgi:magnesium chelatase accessory protein